jgi:hypothetical protein
MQAMPRIGVALYKGGSPFSKEGNFACEFRGVPFEFDSASSLQGQTLWITNCDWGDLLKAGLHKSPKVAHDGYYRTKLFQMMHELGINHLSPDKQASLLAEVLGNASEMARLQLGLTEHPTKGIFQVVAQRYAAQEPAAGSPVHSVAEQASQRYTACERERSFKDAETFSFWFPRKAYAQRILTTPLPDNLTLTRIKPEYMPYGGTDVISLVEWAKEKNLPIFARINILALEPTIGRLLNYGSGAQTVGAAEGRNMREWCSLPELEALSQAGDIRVLDVTCARGWTSPGLLPRNSKLTSVSYAYGLVSENLWYGMTRKPTAQAPAGKTLATAWIQATDRMLCLSVAERLYRLGFEIVNYGNGRVTVVCPKSVRALIPAAAQEEGLLYPGSLEGLDLPPFQSQNPGHVMQHLLSTRAYDRIIKVDQQTLAELGSLHGV